MKKSSILFIILAGLFSTHVFSKSRKCLKKNETMLTKTICFFVSNYGSTKKGPQLSIKKSDLNAVMDDRMKRVNDAFKLKERNSDSISHIPFYSNKDRLRQRRLAGGK